MDVPFVDLEANYRRIQDRIDDRMQAVKDSTQFIGGDTVSEFEDAFAAHHDAKHGIGVASGTDALFLSLRALGIGESDEVITVANTWVSTVDGIVHNGARPRFVDVDPATFTMDTTQLKEAITDDTAAILPVHLYGAPVDLDPILEIADDHGLHVVEDACQAHNSAYRGEPIGQHGDVACFSFYPSKNLGAFGDGGIAVTNDPDLAEDLRLLREYGEREKNRHELIGHNSRLDTIQAAVLDEKLRELDTWTEGRRAVAARYDDLLADVPLETPIEPSWGSHVYHLYVVKAGSAAERDKLRTFLEDAGISTGIHYPTPIHQQPGYRSEVWSDVELPVTEDVTSRILSLPMYPEMSEDEVEYVSDAIHRFFS